jgi:hypothetical protein
MLLIAAYWLFLFTLLLPLGALTNNALKLNCNDTLLTLLLGLVCLTCGFTVTAFFIPLGGLSLLVWTVISAVSGIYYKSQILLLLQIFNKSLRQLPTYLKLVIGILTFGALIKSAQYPFVLDNESYYIQTIKWLDEYGFVKGLANLHIFFAQNSAWHVLQAGTNFSFITNKINDVNGFVFVICMLYCITEGNALSDVKKQYWLSFMPLLALVPFLFIDAPSPDLPLLIILPIIVHLYLKDNIYNHDYKIALLLFTSLVFIKITVAPLAIIFIPGLLKKDNRAFAIITALPVLLLWMAKNTIVSGYPLYPFTYFSFDFNWTAPRKLISHIGYLTSSYGYKREGNLLPEGTTMIIKLKYWLRQDGLAGIINKLTLTLLVFMLLGIFKNKNYRLVYVALLLNFLVVLLTSPQFRYFLHITICGCLFVTAVLFNYFKLNRKIYKVTVLTGSAIIFVTFINFGLSRVTTNKHHQVVSKLRLQQLYLPEGITKFPLMTFNKETLGNLNYYSPHENFLIFGTANGPLPCVNKAQIKYMRRKLGIVPQMRTAELKDGFISVKDSVQ